MGVWVVKSSDENQIYLTVDESLVKISEEKLLELARDIDTMAMPSTPGKDVNLFRIGSENPSSIEWVLNKGQAKGQYVPGQIWIHPDLLVIKSRILAVLQGTKRKVTQQMIIPKKVREIKIS